MTRAAETNAERRARYLAAFHRRKTWPKCTNIRAQVERVNAAAPLEGWAIFNECEIQRIDSQDLEGAPQLADDTAALAIVREHARAGSTLHLIALGIVAAATNEGANA